MSECIRTLVDVHVYSVLLKVEMYQHHVILLNCDSDTHDFHIDRHRIIFRIPVLKVRSQFERFVQVCNSSVYKWNLVRLGPFVQSHVLEMEKV